VTLLLAAPAPGQEQAGLDPTQRSAIVDKVASELLERYLFPEDGARMAQLVRERLDAGEYDALASVADIARRLTADLQSVRSDGHLAVLAFDERFLSRGGDVEGWRERHLEETRYCNFGMQRVERLAGNVGYLRIDGLDHAWAAAETLHAAMQFLAWSDAVILDLRENPGGRPELAQILISYFFTDGKVHYADYDDREKGVHKQWWTLSDLPGRRLPETPLFLLISGNTGSAAEELAFVLRNQERAILVGGTTAGAAHSTHVYNFPELGVTLAIPHGASSDPRTGEDWEGCGVSPHTVCEPEQALDLAYLMALEGLLEAEESSRRAYEIEWALRAVAARVLPPQLEEGELEACAGRYEGDRELRIVDGELHMVHSRRGLLRLLPAGEGLFLFEDIPFWRIQFLRDAAGAITSHRDLWDTNEPSTTWARLGN
jgi:hypothetical protein